MTKSVSLELSKTSIQAIREIRSLCALKAEDQKIVFVSGNFNIVHPGHLRLLRFARECGDFLVVGVLDNSAPGVVLDEKLRQDAVSSISWVDYSFILHDEPAHLITALKPSVVIKGKEYENKENPESESLAVYGGKLLFSSGDVQFSSIDLLRKNFDSLNSLSIQKPLDYPERHSFKLDDLYPILGRCKGLRIAVIGDAIVDEYITCNPVGMSQEDPTIVVNPLFSDRYIGGAAIVAAHARGLGAEVSLLSVCGKDESAAFLKESLEKYGVNVHLIEDTSRPTSLKQRFRAENKTLLRVNHLKAHEISGEYQDSFISSLNDHIDKLDLLVFADFSYGSLPEAMVLEMTHLCKSKDILLSADSQSSSQVGDISRFQDMDLITPTEHEARLAMQDQNSGLVVLAGSLRKKTRAKNTILTLVREGILIHAYQKEQEEEEWQTDRLPAFNNNPQDPAGAGDSFHITSAMSLCVGANIWQSAYLGSLAAACQVARVGNIPLKLADIENELKYN